MQLKPADEKFVTSSTKDEILPVFQMGQEVRLIKDIKNDGTYPFAKVGDTLMKSGATGYVRHIGDFLQTIRVYEVDFLKEGFSLGCREFELEAISEADDEIEQELEWLRKHRESKLNKEDR